MSNEYCILHTAYLATLYAIYTMQYFCSLTTDHSSPVGGGDEDLDGRGARRHGRGRSRRRTRGGRAARGGRPGHPRPELEDAAVDDIGHVDEALAVQADAARPAELADRLAELAPLRHEVAVAVKDLDAVVEHVGGKDGALGVDG